MRTCRRCLRLASRGPYCDDHGEVELDTRRVRRRAQYGPVFQRRAARIRAAARRNWRTSTCGICGGRLFGDDGVLIGRQLHVHHLFRGSDDHLAAAHSACNESEGEPETLGDALAGVLSPEELSEQADRLGGSESS